MTYAKLMNEIWNENSGVVTPSVFKKMLGEYNPTFANYG